jgi:hypothetical protein
VPIGIPILHPRPASANNTHWTSPCALCKRLGQSCRAREFETEITAILDLRERDAIAFRRAT